jgi:hypothetical protein
MDSTEYSGDPRPIENEFSEGDTVIKSDSLLHPDMYHYNLDLPSSLKRKRKKMKSIDTDINSSCPKKRKKVIKPREAKLYNLKNPLSIDRDNFATEHDITKSEMDIELSLDIEGTKQARERLKKLIRIICLWPYEKEIPVNYDILQGKSPYY